MEMNRLTPERFVTAEVVRVAVTLAMPLKKLARFGPSVVPKSNSWIRTFVPAPKRFFRNCWLPAGMGLTAPKGLESPDATRVPAVDNAAVASRGADNNIKDFTIPPVRSDFALTSRCQV